MKNKILISTGGSGGHVIPALTFYDHLKIHNEVFISSDLRGSKFIESKFYDIKIIDVLPLNKNILFLPLSIIFFIIAIFKSLIFLKKNKINTVLSTGGYMSLPVCIGARFLKCKIILFEPNMVIGRANLFLLSRCFSIFCYSKNILNFPDKLKNKIRLISPLLKKEIYLEEKFNNQFLKKVKILIIGGSQGADFFQNNLKDTILKLSEKFQIEILHQVSTKNEKNLKDFYEKNKIKYDLFSFNNSLHKMIASSNLCITRSGASSLAELVHLNIPFIAIPFPHSKDNHQLYNALFYKDLNCCWMIKQSSNISNELYNLILNIFENKDDLNKKIVAMKKISYDNSWNNINKKIMSVINEN